MVKLVENYFEPNRIQFGMYFHIRFHILNFHPFPVFHFLGINFGLSIVLPNHDVIEFMLVASVLGADPAKLIRKLQV